MLLALKFPLEMGVGPLIAWPPLLSICPQPPPTLRNEWSNWVVWTSLELTDSPGFCRRGALQELRTCTQGLCLEPALVKPSRERALPRMAGSIPGEELLDSQARGLRKGKSQIRQLGTGHGKKGKIYKLGLLNPDVLCFPGNPSNCEQH